MITYQERLIKLNDIWMQRKNTNICFDANAWSHLFSLSSRSNRLTKRDMTFFNTMCLLVLTFKDVAKPSEVLEIMKTSPFTFMSTISEFNAQASALSQSLDRFVIKIRESEYK